MCHTALGEVAGITLLLEVYGTWKKIYMFLEEAQDREESQKFA